MKLMFDNPDDDDEEVNLVNPINKLRLCINKICQSTKLHEELQAFCIHTNEEYHEPANDSPTRWSLTTNMIEIALKQKKALSMLMTLSDIVTVHSALDVTDWNTIESHYTV